MRRYTTTFIVCVGSLCLCSAGAVARILENWPYQRLFKESDLIVIATALATEKSGDVFSDERWPLEFVGQNTRFEIKHVVKGAAPHKNIKVLHFQFGGTGKKEQKSPIEVQIINGPCFVQFRTKPLHLEAAKRLPPPDYLLFLKKLPDGRYETVSGKVDPGVAVRELCKPVSD